LGQSLILKEAVSKKGGLTTVGCTIHDRVPNGEGRGGGSIGGRDSKGEGRPSYQEKRGTSGRGGGKGGVEAGKKKVRHPVKKNERRGGNMRRGERKSNANAAF